MGYDRRLLRIWRERCHCDGCLGLLLINHAARDIRITLARRLSVFYFSTMAWHGNRRVFISILFLRRTVRRARKPFASTHSWWLSVAWTSLTVGRGLFALNQVSESTDTESFGLSNGLFSTSQIMGID